MCRVQLSRAQHSAADEMNPWHSDETLPLLREAKCTKYFSDVTKAEIKRQQQDSERLHPLLSPSPTRSLDKL